MSLVQKVLTRASSGRHEIRYKNRLKCLSIRTQHYSTKGPLPPVFTFISKYVSYATQR